MGMVPQKKTSLLDLLLSKAYRERSPKQYPTLPPLSPELEGPDEGEFIPNLHGRAVLPRRGQLTMPMREVDRDGPEGWRDRRFLQYLMMRQDGMGPEERSAWAEEYRQWRLRNQKSGA